MDFMFNKLGSMPNNRDNFMSIENLNPMTNEVPFLPAVTNQMSSDRQPGFSVSNDMMQEDVMKEIVKDQLQSLQENKDILQNMDAGDGSGRNQYQVEINDLINKGPVFEEAYLEEYPIGGNININTPKIMEAVTKAAVPGLGIGTNILDSFKINPKINEDRFSVDNYGYDSLGGMLDENDIFRDINNFGIEDGDFTANDFKDDYNPLITDSGRYTNQDEFGFGNFNLDEFLKDNNLYEDPLREDITNIDISDYNGGNFGSGGMQIVDINDANTNLYNSNLLNNLNLLNGISNNYSSGQEYAQSIADGSNVAGMISPSMSYSAANPQGFSQADINSGIVPDPYTYSPPVNFTSFPGPVPEIPKKLPDQLFIDDGPGSLGRENELRPSAKGYQALNLAGLQRALDNLG